MKFTTRDKDNDQWSGANCAVNPRNVPNGGGWWYNRCAFMFPNNQYDNAHRIFLNGQSQSPPFFEIKIRPKNCA